MGLKVYSLILLSVLIAIIDGFGITLMLPILEGIDSGKPETQLPSLVVHVLQLLGVSFELKGILVFMFIVFTVKALIKMISGYFQSRLYKELYRKLKLGLLEGIMNVEFGYFSSKNSGHFVTILSDHVNRMIASFNIFIAVITTAFMASYYIFLAASLSFRISIIAALFGGTAVLLLSRITKYVKKLSKKIASEEKINSQNAIQSIGSFKYLMATGMFNRLSVKYKKSVNKITAMHFRTQTANVFSRSTRELVTVALLILLIFIETQLFQNSISSILLVLILFYRAVNQLMFIQNNFQLLLTSVGMIESVDEEFSQLKLNRITDGSTDLTAEDLKSNIEFKSIEFAFDSNPSFNLSIEKLIIENNQVLALVGTSGSGKSTLIELLLGVHRAQKGDITFNQKSLKNIRLNSLRNKIGYVSQDVSLFDDSLLNNIVLFEESPDIERVKNACLQANVWTFIETLENGLDTQIGERGIRISGGQKQRISIARELYKNPQLLILDEATSALDVESEMIIQEAIDRLQGKLTVIVIAHRLVTIKNADRIVVMDAGKIIEAGSFNDLSSDKHSRFYSMLNAQKI